MKAMIMDQSPEHTDSNKKKKRRSNRKSKHASSVSGSTSVNEICMDSLHPSYSVSLPKTSNVSFISLPTIQSQQSSPLDSNGTMFSRSCPEPIAYEAESMGSSQTRNDFHLSSQIECHHAQRRCFTPYWSMEAVTRGLEKGDIFKALFRVNAHNRIEAYCKIDGLPTDVLINGIDAQNRAVEGDVVVIKLDPSSSWTKMKGSSGGSSNNAVMDDCNSGLRITEPVDDNCKGKNKVDEDCEYIYSRNLPEMGFNDTYSGENGSPELTGQSGQDCDNGSQWAGCSSEHNENVNMHNLWAIASASPLKRPTGKVVAIVERSPRRDTVVGFLNVRQWVLCKEGYKRDGKKNKHPLLFLLPTDPKFPKMMVPIKNLPDCIKKRVEAGDVTVESELIAAQIVDWGEEHNFPQGRVIRVFGNCGEVEPQIAAILFENNVRSCEFSPETLSSLPRVPWEVPLKEFQTRRDIRNLCLFTIDPSTASEHDDALSVELLPNGIHRVGVHIADVSYFVLPDTALDMEAQFRSTSIYLLQRKLPMLPPLLLENLGSLNPGMERLAFSIFWDINLSGEVLDRWVGRTVIKSCCKLSYEHAQDIIEGLFDVESCTAFKNGLPHVHGPFEWSEVVKSVKSLHTISKILKEKRFKDGALSLENPKLSFLFDGDGIPYDSVLYLPKDSNFLVEEFMLLANTTAAEIITRAYPSSSLLRRHPEPNLQKLRELEAFCSKHGLDLDTSSSGQLHLSLERIRKELKNDSVLFDILLSYATRPMQLAVYFCSGKLEDGKNDQGFSRHYALAVPLYTHFTSPLRRYPDIVVHRTLAAAVEAEESYLKQKGEVVNYNGVDLERTRRRCFTDIYFDKDAVECFEAQEALSAAAAKYILPCTETLADVAAHCNEINLASRHVKDAINKLYMWVLLRNKMLFSEARVVSIGPRFMSIYIQKLAIERRIYYDEVEGLGAEWLDATRTLVLSLGANKSFQSRGSPVKCRPLEEAICVVSPHDFSGESSDKVGATAHIQQDVEPSFFPLTIRHLSTISVALHAVGGNDGGPLDVGARLYVSSYFLD